MIFEFFFTHEIEGWPALKTGFFLGYSLTWLELFIDQAGWQFMEEQHIAQPWTVIPYWYPLRVSKQRNFCQLGSLVVPSLQNNQNSTRTFYNFNFNLRKYGDIALHFIIFSIFSPPIKSSGARHLKAPPVSQNYLCNRGNIAQMTANWCAMIADWKLIQSVE